MSQPRLIQSGDLGEFFRQELTAARDTLGIALADDTEYYLVNLLCDYSKREKNSDVAEEPLALQYKRAIEATPGERFVLLKNLGDESLYVAGFFTEFIERSLVDVSYYISMGGSAYGSLAELMGARRRGDVAGLYERLAARFPDLVDLLNQVSDRARANAAEDHDLLRVYERWLRTGSARLQRILHERGLFVREGLPDDFDQ